MDAAEAYPIIERIVRNGFLTAELRVYGSYMVLKSMTDRESLMLDMYRDSNNHLADLTCKMAFCTFSIDGETMIERRSESIPALMSLYEHAPSSLVGAMNRALLELSNRYYDVLDYLEGFCYTDKSRYLWTVYKEGNLLMQPTAQIVGTNAVQENWAIVNRQLDEEDEYHKQFTLSLMVASSFNGKGARVIGKNYDTNRDELERLRKEISKWGYDKKRVEEEKKSAEWTTPLRSREDIVRELYRQMRGEKDKHDQFMDKWMEKQRKKAEEAKALAEERARQLRERIKDIPPDDRPESRPATSEEMAAFSNSPKSFTSSYMSSFEGVDQGERFIKKLGTRVIR